MKTATAITLQRTVPTSWKKAAGIIDAKKAAAYKKHAKKARNEFTR